MTFQPLFGLDGLHTARSGKLWCTALRLHDGNTCLYSPVPRLAETARELGEISILLAPNHYHNKALPEYAAAFPNAALLSTPEARPRLEKVTGLTFSDLKILDTALPPTATRLTPDGLKTGETWLQIEQQGETVWIVTDAFSSQESNGTPRPALLGTFPKYGLRDRSAFRTWLDARLQAHPPTILAPCHGPPVKDPNLAHHLTDLLDTLAA